MNNYLFVFDLDATITKKEILPEIALGNGTYNLLSKMTEDAMSGKVDFESSFRERVSLLKDIPISQVRQRIKKIHLNNHIVNFIKENKQSCYIVTSNLDVWIYDLIKNLGMESNYFSSNGVVLNDRIISISKIINKKEITSSFKRPFIAIGDGNNDLPMIEASDIGIGFGGVREIAPSVRKIADYNVNSEDELCKLLHKFI